MGNRIVQLLQERKISKYRLSKDTGIPPSSITDWTKHGRQPSADKLKIVADYLGVTVDYLLEDEEKPTENRELSLEDQNLIKDIMRLPEEQRRLVAAQIKAWLQER
jgi:transcriptional regulator with XRE-family HTH domain